jgi:hypothetical protein
MIISQDHRRRLPSVLLLAIRQDSYAKPSAWRQPLLRCARSRAASLSMNAEATPQNGHQPAQQPFLQSSFPAPGLNSAGDRASLLCIGRFLHREHPWSLPVRIPSSLEQAMISQQALMKNALSPHTPSPLPADAHATVTGTDIATLRHAKFDSGVRSSKDGKSGAWWWTCPLRGINTRRLTRQDAQINYLSTLSIFMKQTTYLATLPNPNLKANECHCF